MDHPEGFDRQGDAPRWGTGAASDEKHNGAAKASASASAPKKKKGRTSRDAAAIKRRCVSTACIACRKRKSKCDGNTPSCAACASVYGTECIYDPGSDHRRKGVYKDKSEKLKAKESTLQTIVQAIINCDEEDVLALVRQIRSSESLDEMADSIIQRQIGEDNEDEHVDDTLALSNAAQVPMTFENELSGKMGELRLENGTARYLGGTSNFLYLSPEHSQLEELQSTSMQHHAQPILSWTTVTQDAVLINRLIMLYLTWHYPYFACLSRSLFIEDFLRGKQPPNTKGTSYCSSLLVNTMLALGCHFSSFPSACSDPSDPTTKGDAFFAEAKRLLVENDEHEKPRLTTVQALALMSVREAGCGREAKGWVYSGMSFRMALDMGLNLDITANRDAMDEKLIDARRITFWGCFLMDKCWSNYLGRLPQLPTQNVTVSKIEVFPDEDADVWCPYTDEGKAGEHAQPARTRAVALQLTGLCEISSDLLSFFYHPRSLEKPMGKGVELKRLSELHTRLETWRRDLPKEFESKEGQLPNVLIMLMFYHLQYIHLFRPFLKYTPATSPLPAHVSPRKLCTAAAAAISKLMRTYKNTYGLRQICNIAVYIVHSACTIHLLNLPLAAGSTESNPDKDEDGKPKSSSASEQVGKIARRDIVHGVKHLEEIAKDWLCAGRTLSMISILAQKWKIELPEDAHIVLERTSRKYGSFSYGDVASPGSHSSKEEKYRLESPLRPSPFDHRPGEGVDFGGHSGPGSDRGHLSGTNVGDTVHGHSAQGFSGGIALSQNSSPYESQLSTPIIEQQRGVVGQQQPPSPFGQDGQFSNFTRFLPNRLSSGMQNPQQPNMLHQAQLFQAQQQHHPIHQAQIPTTQPLQPFAQTQHFKQQYSRPLSATSAPAISSPSPNLSSFNPSLQGGFQSQHSTPTSAAPLLSPTALFGQVEALGPVDVSPQDWWLNDQAQIAVGFENWGVGSGLVGTPEMGGEFAGMTGNGQGGQGQGGTGSSDGSGNRSPGLGGWYGI